MNRVQNAEGALWDGRQRPGCSSVRSSVSRLLLRTCHVPGPVQGAEGTEVSQTLSPPGILNGGDLSSEQSPYPVLQISGDLLMLTQLVSRRVEAGLRPV